MFFFILYSLSMIAVLGALAASCISDFRTMTIPNRYPVIVAISFLVVVGVDLVSPGFSPFKESFHQHFIAVVAILVLTFVMFAVRMWGAGDSKLASALALWIGLKGLLPLLLGMALAGLVLGVSSLFLRRLSRFKANPDGSWIGRLRAGQSVLPYGIPIAIGGVYALWLGGFLDIMALYPK